MATYLHATNVYYHDIMYYKKYFHTRVWGWKSKMYRVPYSRHYHQQFLLFHKRFAQQLNTHNHNSDVSEFSKNQQGICLFTVTTYNSI